MKIVHTADWHIGKTLRGRQRGGEFREVLAELKDFIEEREVDLLLVAGDIFDSTTPSAESEDIVYNFFHDVSLLGVKSAVIAGNHDSGLRFEAIASLMKLAGVYLFGFYDMQHPEHHHIILPSRDGREKADIAMVPFISERVFIRAQDLAESKDNSITKHYSLGMGKIFEELRTGFGDDTLNVVMGHLLMSGAKPGGGERRLYLGDNYAVDSRQIPDNIDYIALGHIHLFQSIEAPSPIYYCGSPVQLDFGEAAQQKGFLYLEASPGDECLPQFIPFQKGKKLEHVSGTLEEVTELLESDSDLRDAYLKVTIHSDATALGLSHQVKKQFPNAIDILREYTTNNTDSEVEVDSLSPQWLPDLYQSFYQDYHKKPVPKDLLAEFEKLYTACSKSKEEKKDG